MKMNQITIFVKGEGLRRFNRKEWIQFCDEELAGADEIEVVEISR